MLEPEALETMSLIRGGAFYRFQEVAHLIRPNQWNAVRRIFIARRLRTSLFFINLRTSLFSINNVLAPVSFLHVGAFYFH